MTGRRWLYDMCKHVYPYKFYFILLLFFFYQILFYLFFEQWNTTYVAVFNRSLEIVSTTLWQITILSLSYSLGKYLLSVRPSNLSHVNTIH